MPQTSTIVARVFEHIEPLDRGSRYEDPLDAALRAARLGEVTGGGSQLGPRGEIEYAEIEIRVDNLDDALPIIVTTLQRSGAPVESQLRGPSGVIREFGEQQSVAVYLDGVSLPDAVYAALDFGDTVKRLSDAAGESSYHGYWQGPEETGLFFFGHNAEDMFTRIEPVLRALGIGQNARVVVRLGKDSSRHRTVRIPRQ
jgi:hypothetical protein